jgi:hypothetical protein
MKNVKDETLAAILTILDFMGKLPQKPTLGSQSVYVSFIQEVEQSYKQWEERIAEHRRTAQE